MQKLISDEFVKPFVLTQGPLLRTSLLRLSDSESIFLVTMHHIVSDAWSLGVFIRELRMHYEAFSNGELTPLEKLPIQYADFSHWQQEWLTGAILRINCTIGKNN